MSIYRISKLILVVLVTGFSACDVNRFPETQLSDPSFWKSENDLKTAANYLYSFLPVLPVTSDIWSDDAYGQSPNNISDGTRLAPATDNSFNDPYRLIRAANNILEKAPRALQNGVEAGKVDIYLAEARFFRAWAYFSLVQRYGDVPLILTTLKENSPELTAPASPRAEIVEAIYADLDFASTTLPTPTQLGNAGYGRISKTAALAFKSRVALFEGTRAKFHGYADPNRHLTLALESAKACIDSKEHSLFNSYYNLFQYEGEGRQNRENILVRQYGASIADNITRHDTQRGMDRGFVNPTKSLVDSYLMTDGLPIEKSPLYVFPTTTVEVFRNRDKRLSETVWKRGDPFIGTQPVFTVSGLSSQRTGFGNRKYSNITDWTNNWSYIDYPIIRYAEVLLNYAEAAYELNGSITDADLEMSINLLRERGGVADLTNSLVAGNGLDMREEIRRERRVELALEGFRYWDLIRWKTAEVELPKDVLGNYFYAEYGTAVTPQLTSDRYILVQPASFRSFNPARDYLWPIPINEIALNPALEQNDGW
jgi:starch-binding outer membrane protein, SusD/RagB family